jgi:hypothetical protein
VLNNLAAAAYEAGIRATAVGMELSVCRWAILGPWVAGILQERYLGPTAMLLVIAGAALIAPLSLSAARDE